MLNFYSFHKDYYERLCWLWAMFKNNQKVKKKISNLFKKGTYTILIFDNYRYYAGCILTIKDKNKIDLRCPIELLDLHGPVHWNKRGEDFLKIVKTISNPSNNKEEISGIIIMDLRQLRRIIGSKDVIHSFVKLAFNGVIYVDLPVNIWLVLRSYGIYKSIKMRLSGTN